MKYLAGVFLLVHGIVHLVGFAVPWRMVRLSDMPYTTRVIAGHLDIGEAGIRVLGVLWLVTALAIGAGGIGIMTEQAWWRAVTVAAVCTSLVLCAVQWPATWIGLVANLGILGFLVFLSQTEWFPGRPGG